MSPFVLICSEIIFCGFLRVHILTLIYSIHISMRKEIDLINIKIKIRNWPYLSEINIYCAPHYLTACSCFRLKCYDSFFPFQCQKSCFRGL